MAACTTRVHVSHTHVNKNSVNVIMKIKAVATDMHETVSASVKRIEHDEIMNDKSSNEELRSCTCVDDEMDAVVQVKRVHIEKIANHQTAVTTEFDGEWETQK